MANNLFPVFNVPSVLSEEQITRKRYRAAPAWDYEKGDFARNGANQVQYVSGYDAWVLWCVKTVKTQRWAHLSYTSNAGIEAIEAFAEGDRAAVQSYFERTITEALLADPMGRTVSVTNFEFSWDVDSFGITCLVTGTDGNSAVVTAKLEPNY